MKRLRDDMAIDQAILSLVDGNPGAGQALAEMFEVDAAKGVQVLLKLDDLQIYGTDIWLCYKDHAHQNSSRFMTDVLNEDPEMLQILAEYKATRRRPADRERTDV